MLVLVTGPTGSGKTSLVLAAARSDHWKVIPTFSTRPARVGIDDTKRHIPRSVADKLLRNTSQYRSFEYQGHAYLTPLELCLRAARERDAMAIIDWVHPHPESLEFLGPHVLAVVLLPSSQALASRLSGASRHERISIAAAERENIAEHRSRYVEPWVVHETDASLAELTTWLIRTVRLTR